MCDVSAQFVSAARYQPTNGHVNVCTLGLPARLRRHFLAVNLGYAAPASVETIFITIASAR